MAVTDIWQRFGYGIAQEPRLTLAALLGHAESMAALQAEGLKFATLADFADDPAYDPNPFGLRLDDDWKRYLHLVLALMTWGRDPVLRVAYACSDLQCSNHVGGSIDLIRLRDAAASALQSYSDVPSGRTLQCVSDAAKTCSQVYSVHEADPDSEPAQVTWCCLGAPWMAAEAVAGDWSLQLYEGDAPPESQSTWIRRNAVWPGRAAEAAAHWSTHALVHDVLKSTALAWATED